MAIAVGAGIKVFVGKEMSPTAIGTIHSSFGLL
jgi:hypothetical protein